MNENTDCDKCEYGIKRQLDTNETSFPDEFAHKRIHVRRDLHSNDDKTEVKSECIQNEIRCNDDNKSRSLDNDDKEVVDDKKDMKFVKIDPVITVQTEEMQVQSDCVKDHSNEVILIDSNVDVKPINTEVVPVADCRKSKSENYLNYNVQSFKPECNGRMFSCVHCEDVYVKEDRIKDHLGEVHDCDKCEYGIKRQSDTNENSFPNEFAHKRIHVRRDLYSNDDKTEVKSECIQNEIRCSDDNKSRSLDNDDKEAKPINAEVVPVAKCHKSKLENYLNYNVQSFKPECNGRMFSCVHCEDIYVKEDRIKDHLGEVHGDYHYFCSNCGVYFKEHLEYRQHVYLFRHNCGYCLYGSNRRIALERHCNRVHKDIIL